MPTRRTALTPDLQIGPERPFHAHSAINEVVEVFDQWTCPTVPNADEREQGKVLIEPSPPCSPNIAEFPIEFRRKIEACKISDLFDKLESECGEMGANAFELRKTVRKINGALASYETTSKREVQLLFEHRKKLLELMKELNKLAEDMALIAFSNTNI